MEYWWLKVHGLLHFRCQHQKLHQKYQYQEISCLLHRNTFSGVYMNAATPTATISAATWQQLLLIEDRHVLRMNMISPCYCKWIRSVYLHTRRLWDATKCRLVETIDCSSYRPSHRLAYLAIDLTDLVPHFIDHHFVDLVPTSDQNFWCIMCEQTCNLMRGKIIELFILCWIPCLLVGWALIKL